MLRSAFSRSVFSRSRLPGLLRIATIAACLCLPGCRSFDTYFDIDETRESGFSGWGSGNQWSEDRRDFFAVTNRGMKVDDETADQ